MINDRQLIEEIKKLVSNTPVITGYFNGSYFLGDNNQTYTNLIIPDNRSGEGMIVWWQEKNTWLLVLSNNKALENTINIITDKRRKYSNNNIVDNKFRILYAIIDPPINGRIVGLYTNYYVNNTKVSTNIYTFDNYNNSTTRILSGTINNYNSTYVALLDFLENINNSAVKTFVNIYNDKPTFYWSISRYSNNLYFQNNSYLGKLFNTDNLSDFYFIYKGNLVSKKVKASIRYNGYSNTVPRQSNCNYNEQFDFSYGNILLPYFNGSGNYTNIAIGNNAPNQYCAIFNATSTNNVQVTSSNLTFNKDGWLLYPENYYSNQYSYQDNINRIYTSDSIFSFNLNNYIKNDKEDCIITKRNKSTYSYSSNNTNYNKQINEDINFVYNNLLVDWNFANISNEVNIKLNYDYFESRLNNISNYNVVYNSSNVISNFYLNQNSTSLKLNTDSSFIISVFYGAGNVDLLSKPSSITYSIINNNSFTIYNINPNIFVNSSVFITRKNNDGTIFLGEGVITNINFNSSSNNTYVLTNLTIDINKYYTLPFVSFAYFNNIFDKILINNGSLYSFLDKNNNNFIRNIDSALYFNDFTDNSFYDYFFLKYYVFSVFTINSIKKVLAYNILATDNYVDNYFFINNGGSYNFISSTTFKNNKIYISYVPDLVKTENTNYYVEVWNVTNDGKIFYAPDELITGKCSSLNASTAKILSSSYCP